jgi:hypothetical protein
MCSWRKISIILQTTDRQDDYNNKFCFVVLNISELLALLRMLLQLNNDYDDDNDNSNEATTSMCVCMCSLLTEQRK